MAHGSEVEVGVGVFCFDAIYRLESTDYGVDVVRIDLDPIAVPSGFLGCDQGGAAPCKSIENDSIALGAIENCVGYEGYGLDRGMHGKLGLPIAAKGVLASVIPDVATVATKAAQFHIIDMRGAAVLEYED